MIKNVIVIGQGQASAGNSIIIMNDTCLDNPVWHSLNESHQIFAVNYDGLKCYQPDYCPFGGYNGSSKLRDELNQYANLANDFFIVGERPKHSPNLVLQKELVCDQMILTGPIRVERSANIIQLNEKYGTELYELVNVVQPGYFRKQTMLLGDYFGIFDGDLLVAAAGERMKMNNYTEVSAIVTRAGYTGRGLASQLIAHVSNRVFEQGRTPYLHVADTNAGAISLYNKLGFNLRRKISFWNCRKL